MGEMPRSFEKELAYTPEIARQTAELYKRVAHVMPEIEWAVHAPYIAAILPTPLKPSIRPSSPRWLGTDMPAR